MPTKPPGQHGRRKGKPVRDRGKGAVIDLNPMIDAFRNARAYQDRLAQHGPVKVLVKDGVRVDGADGGKDGIEKGTEDGMKDGAQKQTETPDK